VTLGHTSLLKKIRNIVTLCEEQSSRGSSDDNSKEVVEVTRIIHG
jgi:hypothetical protein